MNALTTDLKIFLIEECDTPLKNILLQGYLYGVGCWLLDSAETNKYTDETLDYIFRLSDDWFLQYDLSFLQNLFTTWRKITIELQPSMGQIDVCLNEWLEVLQKHFEDEGVPKELFFLDQLYDGNEMSPDLLQTLEMAIQTRVKDDKKEVEKTIEQGQKGHEQKEHEHENKETTDTDSNITKQSIKNLRHKFVKTVRVHGRRAITPIKRRRHFTRHIHREKKKDAVSISQ